jgi:valyl-tRNA synthetase
VQTGSDDTRAILERHGAMVRNLGRMATLELRPHGEPPAGSVVSVVGEMEVCLKLAGTIDVNAEQARFDRELAKARKEREQVSGRLASADFARRAPPEIVEKEQNRLAELDERLVRLHRSQERLQKLRT